MKILLLEPFFTGSHKQWAEGYRENSKHDIEIWSLSGHHWKWRMHAGAISFSLRSQEMDAPDVILATDMLDISAFCGMLPPSWKEVPIVAYFHENQLTYPWSSADPDIRLKRDRHYAFINYTSALAADEVWFNSAFHHDSFLQELPDFLNAFPDEKNLHTVEMIGNKSKVMHLGFDFNWLDMLDGIERVPNRIVWNHRWEYDKNPDTFFNILMELKKEGLAFELVVLGQEFTDCPQIFAFAREVLEEEIVHWGYATSRDEYMRLLASCSVIPVTSNQDFFGISAVEAIACGITPLLPLRLAFPEHITEESCFYTSDQELKDKLRDVLSSTKPCPQLSSEVLKYSWKKVAPMYDHRIEEIVRFPGK